MKKLFREKFLCCILTLCMLLSLLPTMTVNAIDNQNIKIQTISLGHRHSAAIKSDGSLWTWGNNSDGQLGDGTTVDKTTPIKVMDNVVSVALGENCSAAIKDDGSLWTWGDCSFGKLGIDTRQDIFSPRKIMDDVIAISMSYNYISEDDWIYGYGDALKAHCAAIKKDGSLWTWGYNEYGQLGDGTTSYYSKVPKKIMDNVVSVALGENYSAAIKKDGSLWTWGLSSSGKLGNGIDDYTSQPTPIKIMENVKSISLGQFHSAAIKDDDSLWTWGENYYGQLGDGTVEGKSTPVKIMDDVKSISLGCAHSAAIKNDGSLWTWGSNPCGELGNLASQNEIKPIEIMNNVAVVSLCLSNSAIVKTDGSLWTWGYNNYGQLGNSTAEDNPNPIMILENVMLPQETAYPNTNFESKDNFPDNMTIDYYNSVWGENIKLYDLNATIEIDDKDVARLEDNIVIEDIGGGAVDYISKQIVPVSPGKTTITAYMSDGTIKKCNLTVTGIKITLNGEPITFDQPPINQEGNLLVPIRMIAENMGKEVLWSDKVQTALIDNTNNALLIPIGETTLYKANEQAYNTWETVKTNVPSQVINGRTLVPIRQFSEALGAKVDWNEKYSTASITYDNIESEKMSDSLYDAINLNYYIGHYNKNPFTWCTDNVIEPFYQSRNYTLDAITMGFGEPWNVVSELWMEIYGDTNASIIIQETLYDVLNEIPEDVSYDLDMTLLKDIKSYTSAGVKLYKGTGGFTDEFLKKHPKLKCLDDAITSKALKNSLTAVDWSIFTAEEIAYILSDYSVNISYLDVLEKVFQNQGIYDDTMENAVNDLRSQYSDKFTEVILDIQNELVENIADVTISTIIPIITGKSLDGSAFGLGKFVWKQYYRLIGVTGKGDALKSFYSIYCYNTALDKELNDAVVAAKNNADLNYIKALINLQIATKNTVINNIADMANWWAKDEVNKSAEELKNDLNSWTYYSWDKHNAMTWLQQ